MAELDSEAVFQVEDVDIIEVIEDADELLERLVADGELLTGGRAEPSARRRRGPRRKARRR
jgi:hypothetical protein